jgi:glutamate-1-semialdehyde aminotransferase
LTFLRSGFSHGYPTFLSRGSGAHVWDTSGRRWVDWVQGKGAVTLGHARAEVDAAVARRASQGALLGACPVEYEELAARLATYLPGTEQAMFTKNGSDAVHAALRLAKVFTGRDLIVSAGYHGWDDRLLPGAAPTPVPGAVLDFGYDLVELERVLAEHGPRVAAVLVTPEPAFFGREMLERAAELARSAQALFVVDEVRAGLRVAPAGAHQHFGVSADLFTLSKGLANGYPLAAVLGRKEVLEASSRTYVFGTYYAEAAALAAGLASVELYQQQDVVAAIWRAGEDLMLGLEALFADEGLRARCLGPAPVFQILFEDEVAEAAFYAGSVRRGVLFFQDDAQCPSAAHGDHHVVETLAVCREVAREIRRERQGGRAERLETPSPELLARSAKRRMIRPEALDAASFAARLGRAR